MKISILFLSVIYFISNTKIFCQDADTMRRHIGINAFSLQYVGKDNAHLFFKIRPSILSGITYKKDYKNLTSRYSLTLNKFKTEVGSPDIIDGYTGFYYYTIWSINSGIQINHHFKKILLFYGLDLCNDLVIHKIDISRWPGW